MVSAGPSPGSTPIAVPSVVPTRHHIRLMGEKATENPCARWRERVHGVGPQRADARIDTVFSFLDEAGADVDAERLGEAEIGGERQHQSDQRVGQRPAAAEAVR